MSVPAVSLLLLRHGQSEWNAVRRWQGLADSPLTELGRRQAHGIGSRLAAGVPAHVPAALDRDGDHHGDGSDHVHPHVWTGVWCSDLRRASETARIVSSYLGLDHVRVDPRLREADAGPWQGLTPEQIERDWPGYLGEHRRPDGFEPADAVVERAMSVCTEMLAGVDRTVPAATVVAVTHSGFIRALRRHLGAHDHRIPNLGGAWIHLGLDDDLVAGPLFDPIGPLPLSGVDGPGEDPGDESDHGHHRRGAEGGLAR